MMQWTVLASLLTSRGLSLLLFLALTWGLGAPAAANPAQIAEFNEPQQAGKSASAGATETAAPLAQASQARKYAQEGNYRAAVIEYKNALKAEPENAQLRRELAEIYLTLRIGPAAEKELRQALRQDPRDTLSKLHLIQAFWLQRNYPDMLTRRIEVEKLEQSEQRAQMHLLLGRAHLAEGAREPAIEQFELARGIDNAATQAGQLADLLLTALDGDLAGMTAMLSQQLEQYPDSVERLEISLDLHLQAGELVQAHDILRRLTERFPHLMLYPIQLAELQIKRGELDDAEKLLSPILKHSEAPMVHYLWATLQIQRQDHAAAATTLAGILSRLPDFLPAMFLAGGTHYELGNLAQAEKYLGQFLQYQPEHLPALRLLAAIHIRRENPNAAAQLLQRAARLDGSDTPLLAAAGLQALRQGDRQQAEQMLQQANQLQAQSDNPAGTTQAERGSAQQLAPLAMLNMATGNGETGLAQLKLAANSASDASEAPQQASQQVQLQLFAAYLSQGQYAQAKTLANHWVQNFPQQETGYVMRAVLAKLAGDQDKVVATLEKALEQQPGAVLASHLLGMQALQAQQPQRARKLYVDAWQATPGHPGLARQLYLIDHQRGELDQALSWLAEGARLHPENAYTKRLYATALLQRNERALQDEGINQYRELITQHNLARDHYALARALKAQTEYSQALSHIEQALQSQPQSADHLQLKTELLLLLERYKQADELIQGQLALEPEAPRWLWLGANWALGTRDLPAARDYLHSLYQHQPEGEVLYRLGEVWLALQDYSVAQAEFESWLKVYPEDTLAIGQLARIYLALEQPAQARAQYQRLVELEPDNILALNNLAWLLLQAGEPAEGLVHAERALALAPDSEYVQDTLQQIRAKLNAR